ncbi:MAG TPA: hypothetical protein VJ816_07985 [Gemmatimonadales bacterium]|nr:hypothetical protein [Gemmatimonadales bacterium]
MPRLAGGLSLLALFGVLPVGAQSSAGAELWRLWAVTIPLPAALATGAASAYWNPAQTGPGQIGVDVVQTPQAVGATGVVAAVRMPAGRIGSIGLLYARMSLGDLVHTTDSPDPDGAPIPYYTQRAAVTWAADWGRSTVGVAASYHNARLDGATNDRWSIDFGVSHRIGTRLRLAAATRGLRRVGSDPAQDVSGGVEFRFWRGALWRDMPGSALVRYGVVAGHPGGVDHQFGLGLVVGLPVTVDVVIAREASYGNAAWRGAAGLRVAVGRYRMSFARDAGISDLGSSYRVGLEARLR